MAQLLKIAFVSGCLLAHFVCIGGNPRNFYTERGEYDTFSTSNVECQNTSCANDPCYIYNAECASNECEFCQCSKQGQTTFLQKGQGERKCTKDENILPETIPTGSFTLKNTNYDKCLSVERNDKLVGMNCTSSLKMRWIYIKHSMHSKLLNIGTLKCLQFLKGKSTPDASNVTVKPCGRYIGQNIRTRTNMGRIYSILDQKSYHLNFLSPQNGRGGFLDVSSSSNVQKWTNTKHKHYINNNARTSYKGCYHFGNERFMLFLNRESCAGNLCFHKFSAPLFADNSECTVKWSESKLLGGESSKWYNVPNDIDKSLMVVENSERDVKILKIKQQALNVFNGSLLKLAISCNQPMKRHDNTRCVLLKFESKPKKLIKPKIPYIPNQSTAEPIAITTERIRHKHDDKSSIKTIAIAVPISLCVIILLLVLVYFVSCRRRIRAQELSKHEGADMNNPYYSRPVYEDPNRVYEVPGPNKQAASPARYEYIDNAEITKSKHFQPELKYDYAANTDISRLSLEDTLANCEDDAESPGNIYHTLERPESPTEKRPKLVVHSTPEEQPKDTNPLVEHENLRSEDPVYEIPVDSSEMKAF